MAFNSIPFLAFFLTFFLIFKLALTSTQGRLLAIVVGSIVFYASWNWHYVPLLMGMALSDFFLGRAIEHQLYPPTRRRALLLISISVNLGVLAYFKYTGFLLHTLHVLGLSLPFSPVEVDPPLGLSFFAFQNISYTVDVYRGNLRSRERPVEYLAGLMFFPHLLSGPIVKPATYFPQFTERRLLPWVSVRRGLTLIVIGLLKKSVADRLGSVADGVFAATGPQSALTSWTGALAFTGQIFGDFSGYTDMAIGMTLLLGFHLPPNFNLPYLAESPLAFWQRWHISLSVWLRDYVYSSLRGGPQLHYRNLLITMVLSGLWHGAQWTFVAWGLYHGVLLAFNHWLSLRWPWIWTSGGSAWRGFRIALTFYAVVMGWVLFRSKSFDRAWAIWRDMHGGGMAGAWSPGSTRRLAIVVLGLLIGHGVSYVCDFKFSRFQEGILFWPTLTVILACGVLLGGDGRTFFYFQF